MGCSRFDSGYDLIEGLIIVKLYGNPSNVRVVSDYPSKNRICNRSEKNVKWLFEQEIH